jgi:hypothetical protein
MARLLAIRGLNLRHPRCDAIFAARPAGGTCAPVGLGSHVVARWLGAPGGDRRGTGGTVPQPGERPPSRGGCRPLQDRQGFGGVSLPNAHDTLSSMGGMQASDQMTRPAAAADESIRPTRRLPRGTLTGFVKDHQRAWDATMGGLAVVFIAVTFWHDDSPGPASRAALVVLTLLFVAEFTARLLDARPRLSYLRHHWIDAISCVPIPMIGGSLRLLRLLRSELEGLRDALRGGATQPTAGGDGARMARLAGDGRAVHDGRWHLVGRQDGASATPSP